MRLADEIIAAKGSLEDPYYCPVYRLAKEIARAECFELAPDVHEACLQVSRSRPSSILSALKFARLPYQDVWLEWIPQQKGEPDADRGHPARVGCLLQAHKPDNLSSGVMQWAWIHRNNIGMEYVQMDRQIVVSPYTCLFDWRDEADMPSQMEKIARDLATSARPDLANAMKEYFGYWDPEASLEHAKEWGNIRDSDLEKALKKLKVSISDEKEREAIRSLMKRCIIGTNINCVEMWRGMNSIRNEGMAKEIASSWMKDLEGEYPFATAFVLMLNSKGAISAQRDDLSPLNKARAKRGRTPLKEFIVTRINLDRVAARGRAMAGDRAAARKHLVRGHFKTRASGVFWWSPFIRGTGDSVMRERYEVVVGKE